MYGSQESKREEEVMNDKVMTTTVNADGQVVRVIADTAAALATAVTTKKLDRKKGFNNV
jgi:hypothetical protein